MPRWAAAGGLDQGGVVQPGAVGTWWGAAGDLLLGARCPGCAEPGVGCCAGFRRALLRSPLQPVPGVGVAVAAARWEGVVRQLVTAYKERQAWWLAPLLAGRLAVAVAEALRRAGWAGGPLLLVPAPSSPAAVRERGLDTTNRLAVETARVLRRHGLDVRTGRRLVHRRRVRDQAGLDALARQRNLAGALRARRGPLAGEGWVLLDDVSTTGSTLREARRASTAAGAEVVAAAVLAVAQRDP